MGGMSNEIFLTYCCIIMTRIIELCFGMFLMILIRYHVRFYINLHDLAYSIYIIFLLLIRGFNFD